MASQDDEYVKLYRATAPKTAPEQAANELIDAYKNYKPESQQQEPTSSGVQYLLEKAGLNPDAMKEHLMAMQAGLLEKPGYEPQGIGNNIAYAAGKYGPTAAGATLGSMIPGAGTAAGAALGAGAGAAMGRSLQNLGQVASNQVSPGSAANKSPGQLMAQPGIDAATQGLAAGATTGLTNFMAPRVGALISGETGVKPNLVGAALKNLDAVFSSPSVKQAGEAIGEAATKAGIKTGTDGYKLATAEILGQKAATDEMSTATTLAMAKTARETGQDALSDQAKYSLAEGLRKAMQAPKYADPHGPLAQNFRMYAEQLSGLEDSLEKSVQGYAEKRAGYVNALAKEAFSSLHPLNKNGTPAQLKMMMQLGLGGEAARRGMEGDARGAGAALLTASMMSPLLMGKAIQGASKAAATQIPQLFGRGAVAAGSDSLSNALGSNQGQ